MFTFKFARATVHVKSNVSEPHVYSVQIESPQDSISLNIRVPAEYEQRPRDDFIKMLGDSHWAFENYIFWLKKVENQSSGSMLKYYFRCFFCLYHHSSYDCPAYPTVSQRKKILELLSICWKCLETEHEGMPCVKLANCEDCNVNSHPLVLCPHKCKTNELTGAIIKQSDELSVILMQRLEPGYDHRPTRALTTTTAIELLGHEGLIGSGVRLVIARGSSSMITESVVDRLWMRSYYEEKLADLKAAGETEKNVEIRIVVHVSNGPPVPLKVQVVKNICDQPVFVPTLDQFRKEHRHLANMRLSCPKFDMPIEMLIGGESELASVGFNRELNGEKCPPVNHSQGWSLVSSMFGWIIVGTDTSDEPVMFSLENN